MGHAGRRGHHRVVRRRLPGARAAGAGARRAHDVTRVFLTGGSGLIGGALAARLVERGDEVLALARSDEAARALAGCVTRVVRGDVLDEDAMAAGMAGCALVYHVAGVNTMCPADPAALFHVYVRSKHEGELAAFATARRAGIELVSINPSSVQGPGRAGGTGRIMIAYLNGRLPAFLDTQVSIVDIADCVEGHLLGAERGVPGERYLLNGATLSSREALETFAAISGVRRRVRFLPRPVAAGAAALVEAAYRARGRHPPVCREMVRTLVHGHRYDGSRAERELGVRYTPIAETFRRTIEWAEREGLVKRRPNSPAHSG